MQKRKETPDAHSYVFCSSQDQLWSTWKTVSGGHASSQGSILRYGWLPGGMSPHLCPIFHPCFSPVLPEKPLGVDSRATHSPACGCFSSVHISLDSQISEPFPNAPNQGACSAERTHLKSVRKPLALCFSTKEGTIPRCGIIEFLERETLPWPVRKYVSIYFRWILPPERVLN